MELHPQLLADCHRMGAMDSGALLLHRDASVPWFILVPDSQQVNLLELQGDRLQQVMTDCQRLSRYITDELGWPRVNVASIGNMVPQLHVHVVGRRPGDACWPRPVWGNLGEPLPWDPEAVRGIRRDLGFAR